MARIWFMRKEGCVFWGGFRPGFIIRKSHRWILAQKGFMGVPSYTMMRSIFVHQIMLHSSFATLENYCLCCDDPVNFTIIFVHQKNDPSQSRLSVAKFDLISSTEQEGY